MVYVPKDDTVFVIPPLSVTSKTRTGEELSLRPYNTGLISGSEKVVAMELVDGVFISLEEAMNKKATKTLVTNHFKSLPPLGSKRTIQTKIRSEL